MGVADLNNNNFQGNATFQACSLINLTFILMTLIWFSFFQVCKDLLQISASFQYQLSALQKQFLSADFESFTFIFQSLFRITLCLQYQVTGDWKLDLASDISYSIFSISLCMLILATSEASDSFFLRSLASWASFLQHGLLHIWCMML